MTDRKCPNCNQTSYSAGDEYAIPCPYCGAIIEAKEEE